MVEQGTGSSDALDVAGLVQGVALGGAGSGVGCTVGLGRGQLGSEAPRWESPLNAQSTEAVSPSAGTQVLAGSRALSSSSSGGEARP